MSAVSYTHLDVYKRQGNELWEETQTLILKTCYKKKVLSHLTNSLFRKFQVGVLYLFVSGQVFPVCDEIIDLLIGLYNLTFASSLKYLFLLLANQYSM